MTRTFLIGLFILMFQWSWCQEINQIPVISIDSSYIEKKEFDPDRIQRYIDSGDYDYRIQEKEPSFFERVWIWLKRSIISLLESLFDDIGSILSFLAWFFRALPYIILLIALILIIRYFIDIKAHTILKKPNIDVAKFSSDEELIESENLEDLLKESLSLKDWRLSIRFYYLLTLQQLSRNQLIQWKQEKTNEDYLKELEGKSLYDDFKSSTRLYDFIWYGKFDIKDNEFDQAKKIFHKLLGKNIG